MISYAARGYPPSDVPTDVDRYDQAIAVSDAVAVLDGLGIGRAHVVGLSMGGFATVHFGLRAPGRALSLTVAGAGYGCETEHEAYFRQVSLDVADNFERQGAAAFAPVLRAGGQPRASSRTRTRAAGRRSPRGSPPTRTWARALTMARGAGAAAVLLGPGGGVARASSSDARFGRRRRTTHCLQPGIFLKKTVPACGLAVLPKTGHTLNLEEPGAVQPARRGVHRAGRSRALARARPPAPCPARSCGRADRPHGPGNHHARPSDGHSSLACLAE